MSRQPNFINPKEFLEKAILIYENMKQRRWDVTMFGMDSVRSQPNVLIKLKETMYKENVTSETRYDQITTAINSIAGRQKLSLILKIIQIPYALEAEIISATAAIQSLHDLSDKVMHMMQPQTEQSKYNNGWALLQSYVNQTLSSLSSWTSNFSNDWQFSLDAHALLMEITQVAQQIAQIQYEQSLKGKQEEVEKISSQVTDKIGNVTEENATLLKKLQQNEQFMQQLQGVVKDKEASLKAAEEEQSRLKELLDEKEKMQEKTKEECEDIIYQYTRDDVKFITKEIVERLEEYTKAHYVFADLLNRVISDKSGVDEIDRQWAQDMYDRFESIYRLIFDSLDSTTVDEYIENNYPNEYLDTITPRAQAKISELYSTSDFLYTATNFNDNQDTEALRAFKEKAERKSEAKKAMAAFSEELMKRIENLQKKRISEYAKLARPFAKRNEKAMQKHIEQAIEKEKQQRKMPVKSETENSETEQMNGSETANSFAL